MKRGDSHWLLEARYPELGKRPSCSQLHRIICIIAITAALLFLVGMAVVIVNEPTGDVNGDKSVNATDLVQMKRHLLGKYDLSYAGQMRGDLNRNGRIDNQDIEAVKDIILGR